MGNQYGNYWRVIKPKISADSEVYSTGDKFCYPVPVNVDRPNNFCANSGFDVIFDPLPNAPSPLLYILTNREESLTKPIMKIQYPWGNKVLMEMGGYNDVAEFKYSFTRDGNGWLKIEGSQANPNRGFIFNGLVVPTTPAFVCQT